MTETKSDIHLSQSSQIKGELSFGLPTAWIITTLGETFVWGSGGTPKKGNPKYYDGNIPWLVIGDLNDGIVNESNTKITELGLKNSSAKLVATGSLLLAMYGSIGRLGIAGKQLATNQAIAFAKPNEINTLYLFYYLKYVRNRFIGLGKGATQQNISQTVIKEFPFVLAPLKEQRRIVAKIEELFSELDKGIESLKTAREQLKVYRQAVLKHAFEGKLTTKWREQNRDKLESPEQLLAHIKQEREIHYQQQLKDWKTAVTKWENNRKGVKKPSKPFKTRLMSRVEPDNFNFPNSWTVLELGSLASESVLGKMLDKQKNMGSMRCYLGNINVRWGAFDLAKLKSMRIEDHEVERYRLIKGDLVICEGGEPGRCAVWNGSSDNVFIQKALHRVRFTESYDSGFAYYYIVYAITTHRITKYFTGTTIKHLTGAGLEKIKFPVCSMAEQREIVANLDQKLTNLDSVDQQLSLELNQSEILRQSILKKAFSGQLVHQDPNDEPASTLLARIRAEKIVQESISDKRITKKA